MSFGLKLNLGLGLGLFRPAVEGAQFLLDQFSGASAAYSVRQLSSTSTNALRVRRDSDNAEQDIGFVDGSLDTASLESFVTGYNDTLPLDTASATAAYSLRSLSSSYTGNVVRVRRDSDNAESDFNPTEITDGTMATWIGANNGFVTTWYDQSGNSNNATQATTADQPKIYDSSIGLITQNAKPAIDFDGSTQRLTMAVNVPAPYFLSIVAANTNYTAMFDGNTGGSTIRFSSSQVSLWPGYVANNLPTATNGIVISNLVTPSQNPGLETDRLQTWANSASLGEKFSTNLSPLTRGTINPGQIGYSNAFGAYTGNIQELILYNSDQSSNRTAIEGNINKHYNIYSSNGFVTTWYDQSGNGNDVTQATTTAQPKIYDATTGLITENGKPSISFDGVDDKLSRAVFSTSISNIWNFTVIQRDLGTNGAYYKNGRTSGFGTGFGQTNFDNSGDNIISVEEGVAWKNTNYSTNTELQQIITHAVTATDHEWYQNNQAIASSGKAMNAPSAQEDFNIGGYFNLAHRFLNCKIQEMIIYDADQSSNRTGIETNIDDHFNIFTPVAPWTPANLTNLEAWYDASDSTTITLNGSNVSQWDDKSGNNYDWTQSTASAQPLYTTNGLGNDVVRFATGDWLNNSNSGFYALLNSDNSVFMQVETTTLNTAANGRMLSGEISSGFRWGIAQRSSGYSFLHNTSFSPVTYTGATPTNNATIGYTFESTTPSAELYFDGTNTDSTSSVSTLASVDQVAFGAQDQGGQNANFNGDLQELVVTSDSLSTDDRQKLEGYLAHKWGTEANLPGGHPYKSSPPTI